MDESALIREAQRGDLDSFNTLVLHYQEIVFNTAVRILGDTDQAADASQDAFISAFRSIASYRGGSFKSWLLRTVTHTCFDELRRRKKRNLTPLEVQMQDSDEIDTSDWIADPNMTPAQRSEAAELERAIQHCLDELPTEFRMVAVLADVQGVDYTEVATALDVPVGTVKSRLSRARLRLRDCLRSFEELLPAAFRLQEETGT